MHSLDNKQDRQVEDVRLILKDLLKVIKVVSMYPESNPLPQSLRRTFSERLADVVESYGEIVIKVERDKLLYDDEQVFTDRSREESLAGMFHENGITQFVFKEGLEVEDIYVLLDVIKEYQNSFADSRDLANDIWEATPCHFTFETIEDVALAEYDGDLKLQELFLPRSDDEGLLDQGTTSKYDELFAQLHDESGIIEQEGETADGVGPDPDNTQIRHDPGSIPADDESGQPELSGADNSSDATRVENLFYDDDGDEDDNLMISRAVEAMGLKDVSEKATATVDTTVVLNAELKLSEDEVTEAAQLIEADADFDLYESTVELAKEMLHQETELSDFNETVTIAEKIITSLIDQGKLTYAAGVLRYYIEIQKQIETEKPLWAERIRVAVITLGSRDRLIALTEALNEYQHLGSLELRGYLDNFGWEALMGISDMLAVLDHEHHRETVSDYLALRGRDNLPIIARGVYDKRPDLVIAAIKILGCIDDDRALTHLSKTVAHTDLQVRRTLVEILQDFPQDAALALLQKMVTDSDRSIRSQAVKSIVARKSQAAFDVITEIINDPQFAQLDPDDKQSILKAYSVLGSDVAVSYLLAHINRLNPFGNATLKFYRDAAFEALAVNRSERAEKTLVTLSSSWRVDIKNRAIATMKKRRELIFGGGDDQSS